MRPAGQSIESILATAVEMPSEAERRQFVHDACAGDIELQARLEQLIANHFRAGSFLEWPPAIAANQRDANQRDANQCDAGTRDIVDVPIREAPGTVIGPYKLVEQIGEGSFGVVFLAEQTQPVRRKVALKVLKPGMDTRQVVARFEAERQALAIMDHPNIAQVHDGGVTASGRPYFVMELVKGAPLSEFCDQNQLTLRQRLELFVSVCQAVQHAHQKGIIHRDLKPSNVLVSRHDTTPVVKVIDFGVAKALGQALTDKTLCTGLAQMVGTPLYMSPEQAGMSDLDVDTRSDIYALGVLLYELLTGTTPFNKQRFKEAGYDEMRRIIRDEEPPRPSTRISTLGAAATTLSGKCQSDPRRLRQLCRGELDWIVMKALEKDRNRRYDSASAFAADVERYLRDEPVQACPPSPWYRCRKFAWRNRTSLTVSVLVTFCIAWLAAGGGWIAWNRGTRQAKAASDLDTALEWGERFQEQGKRAEALAALSQAELLATEAGTPLRAERLTVLQGKLAADARDAEFTRRFEHIRLSVQSEVKVLENRFALEAVFPEIAGELRRFGIDMRDMSPMAAAAYLETRPELVRRTVIAALDECLKAAPKDDTQARQWLLDALAAADRDAWRVQVRQAAASHDWCSLASLAGTADVLHHPPSFLLFVADSLPTPMQANRLALLRRVQRAYPADLWANHGLAQTLADQGQPAEAIAYYTAAVALRPENAGIYYNRGLAQSRAGNPDAAIADFRQAINLASDYAEAHHGLAQVLYAQGQIDEAIPEYREARRLKPGYAATHNNLGICLAQKGQLDEAISAFRDAIRLKRDYAEAHNNLGAALRGQRRLDDAIAAFHDAIGLKKDYADAHCNLGVALRDQGAIDAAIAACRVAIGINKQFAEAHRTLGLALRDKGRLDDAIAAFRDAIGFKNDFAEAYTNLGAALRDQGRREDAIAAYRKAVHFNPDDAESFYNLGVALMNKGEFDEAIAACRAATALKRDYSAAHFTLGAVLQRKGKNDDAIVAYREAIRTNQDNAAAHNNLGALLFAKGQLGEAIGEFRVTVGLQRNHFEAQCNLGAALGANGQFDDAIAALRVAIGLKEDYAPTHFNLGAALYHKGQVGEAVAELRAAIRLQNDYAQAHYRLAWVLATAADPAIRDPAGALQSAKKAVALASTAANWTILGLAHYRVGDDKAALAAFQKSMKLRSGGDACDWFFVAMAYQRLGDGDAARAWYDRAMRWMDMNQSTNEELRRFRDEAAHVLAVGKKPQ
jgi:tetratricopeptide (TPR) repeat protein